MDKVIETHASVVNNKIILSTNDDRLLPYFTVDRMEKGYSPFTKSLGMVKKTYKIFNKRSKPDINGVASYEFGLGWVSYIARILKGVIPDNEYYDLVSTVYSNNPILTPFPGLRDYQNEDVLFMLKFRRAVCSVYTSYGKLYLPHYISNENRAKTVKGVIPNTVLNSIIAKGILSV